MLVAALLPVAACNGGGSNSSAAAIEDTIRGYVTTYNAADFAQCLTYFTDYGDESDALGALAFFRSLSGELEYRKIKDIAITGQTATVSVVFVIEGEEGTDQMSLKKVNGKWKILWEQSELPPPETIAIVNPAVTFSGVSIYDPEEKVSDPRAGAPEYVYLVSGLEAVRLIGPEISSSREVDIEDVFYLDNEEIKLIGAGEYSAEGYEVMANSHLSYGIAIDDFEYEIDLARVELAIEGGIIHCAFVFVAIGDGIARDVMITAVVDGNAIGTSPPISIEARSP